MAKKDRAKEASFVPILEPNRVVTVDPNFASLYANDIQVQTSPWDMRLIFGEVGDVIQSDVPALTIKRIGELRISLPLAKKLALIMIDQVKSYEAQVGEVPLPKV
jgi:hypothetical protein